MGPSAETQIASKLQGLINTCSAGAEPVTHHLFQSEAWGLRPRTDPSTLALQPRQNTRQPRQNTDSYGRCMCSNQIWEKALRTNPLDHHVRELQPYICLKRRKTCETNKYCKQQPKHILQNTTNNQTNKNSKITQIPQMINTHETTLNKPKTPIIDDRLNIRENGHLWRSWLLQKPMDVACETLHLRKARNKIII